MHSCSHIFNHLELPHTTGEKGFASLAVKREELDRKISARLVLKLITWKMNVLQVSNYSLKMLDYSHQIRSLA